MTEEPVAETGSFVRALDQAGDVGQDELLLMIEAHHAELWVEGGERVVGDLGAGGRDGREEGGLAGIRQPDQACIGDQLEPEPDPALLAGKALVGPPRCTIGAGLVVRVAEPAVAAACQRDLQTRRGEIGEQRLALLVHDLRADRNLDHHRVRGGARAIRTGTVAALPGPEMLCVAEVDQRVQVMDGFEDDVPATPPIAAVRATELDILLAPECADPVAAVTGADEDLGLIEKLHA